MKFRVQEHRLTKRLQPTHKTTGLPLYLPTNPLKAYLSQFILLRTSCLALKKKISRDAKTQKHSLKRLNKYQNQSDIARILELSDQKFFKPMIYMPKALTKKDMKDKIGNVS